MVSTKPLKQSYLKKVARQLAKYNYSQEDSDAILLGLSEHIDEEIWQLKKDKQEINTQIMHDLLANLELPESINPDEIIVTDQETATITLTDQLAKVSIGLALFAFPLFYLTGYFDSNLSFDVLFFCTVLALSLAAVSYKSHLGKKALLACTIPLAVLLGIFILV